MARIRNIKPKFFEDTLLAEISIPARFLYIGLWCFMDKHGLCEYDAKLIKHRIFPYDGSMSVQQVEDLLVELLKQNRLVALSHEGKQYLFCPTFAVHQKIHGTEKSYFSASLIKIALEWRYDSVIEPLRNDISSARKEKREIRKEKREKRNEKEELPLAPIKNLPGDKPLGSKIFDAYSEAIESRWGVKPPRNAKVNAHCAQLAQRLGTDAIAVVRFYVRHNEGYYIRQQHSISICLRDAESLHVQWQRGRTTTSAEVRSMEKDSQLQSQLSRIEKGEL